MNSEPQTYQTADMSTVAQPAPQYVPTRTVEDMLSACRMRGCVCIPRKMRLGMTVLCLVLTVSLLLGTVVVLCGGASMWVYSPPTADTPNSDPESTTPEPVGNPTYPYADGKVGTAVLPSAPNAATISASLIGSSHAVLADVTTGEVIASLGADEYIYPASMTKVMTLIVAVENLPYESSLSDTVTISEEVFERMAQEGSSGVGLEPGEKLTVEALLYALMLKSDGVAACELARYVAGSEEAFVDLMNQKAAAMGLTGTHFENPTGLHHEKHKSTVRNIAAIMAYAMDMKLCREILVTKSYNAPAVQANGKAFTYTFYHNLLVTHFESTKPHQPNNLTVIAGKTGFTDESRHCLVTYAQSKDGRAYICVTANAPKPESRIKDYIAIYNTYANP